MLIQPLFLFRIQGTVTILLQAKKEPSARYTLDKRNQLPRIAEGKHLKLLYTPHEQTSTLNARDAALQLCPKCDLATKCPEKAKLTVYCLEGLFQKTL